MKKLILTLTLLLALSGCAFSTKAPEVSLLPKPSASLVTLCPDPLQIQGDPKKVTKAQALNAGTENNKELRLCGDKVKGWVEFYDRLYQTERVLKK